MLTEADPRMITRVALRNYKSIAACDITLAPLIILVGPKRRRQEQLPRRFAVHRSGVALLPRPRAAGARRNQRGSTALPRSSESLRRPARVQTLERDRLVRIRGRRRAEGPLRGSQGRVRRPSGGRSRFLAIGSEASARPVRRGGPGATAAPISGHGPMTDLLLSNDALDGLRSASKRVRNPGARWLEKPGRHKQRNLNAVTEDGEVYRIYQRQNLDDEQDFSCGLALVRRGGEAAEPGSLQRGEPRTRGDPIRLSHSSCHGRGACGGEESRRPRRRNGPVQDRGRGACLPDRRLWRRGSFRES